jgi:hypothetical protein
MPFSGTGAFTRLYSFINDAAAGVKIRADRMDAEFDGISSGLSNCITKDGQTAIASNLPMSTKKHLNVGDTSARTDYAKASQVIDGSLNWVDGGGTANAITATYSIPLTTLVDGQLCFVRATAANSTTTPTFSPSGLTARTIVKNGGTALVAGDIAADGHQIILRYDLGNTRWELLNPAVAGVVLSAGNNTISGNNTLSGTNTFTGLMTFTTESLLTIAAGVITPTGIVHTLANEGGASSDNLTTITAGADGQLLFLSPSDATDVTTIDEAGNISLNGATTLNFSTTTATAVFIYRTAITKWVLLALFDGASKSYVDAQITSAKDLNYTSSDQVITVAGQIVLAHGLGGIPDQVNYYLVCQTGEGAYTAGDIVGAEFANSTSGNNAFNSPVVDATNITIRYSDDAAVFYIGNKTSGAVFGITPANWRLRVKARKWV